MLALVVIFIATGVPPDRIATAAATQSPRPTARPTVAPTVTPTASPTSCLRTAVLRKNTLEVPGRTGGRPPSDAAIVKAFRRFGGKQVGLLLTYGHGSTPAAGVAAAGDVNRLLRQKLPETVTARTLVEDFFNSAGTMGTVTFDVYLLAADCS